MSVILARLARLLGSLVMAFSLLLLIAAVLACGTIYEARFGTEAAQHVVYRSWWFQSLLGFLALNLAIAALERLPWQRKHIPFVLAHIGIISMLVGGMLGGRFGIDGQLIIPEGESRNTLQLAQNLLVAYEPNPGVPHVFATHFEATAWQHEPNTHFRVPLADRSVELVVDRYYPNAVAEEQVTPDGAEENPALHLAISHEGHEDAWWLVARDPQRFGARWGEAHLIFLEPTPEDAAQLLNESPDAGASHGTLTITLPGSDRVHTIPVPAQVGQPVAIDGTPYRITFKDYFPDFALTKEGVTTRSDQPNNPAVSFTLSGPEGTDAHLLFALYPEFPDVHGLTQTIHAQLRYTHPAGLALPPSAICFMRLPSGELTAIMTGSGSERQRIATVAVGTRYRHPWLGYEFTVTDVAPRARITPVYSNRDNDVRSEALHVVGYDGDKTVEVWLTSQNPVTLGLGKHSLIVEYRPAQRALPFTVKLLDFRKIDYPGTEMPSGFESDVELTDPQRGLMLMRKISMNHPLRYRGYSLFQSSYIPGSPPAGAARPGSVSLRAGGAGEGSVETTVLSVRNDPGTPFVYAGFVVVIIGIISMFILRTQTPPILPGPPFVRAGAGTPGAAR